MVSIDPFPTGYLTRMAESKAIQLISAKAQDVDLGVLTGLGAGDLLFVDSETGEAREITVNERLVAAYKTALGQYTHGLESFCRSQGIGYTLVSAASFSSSAWLPVTNGIVNTNGSLQAIVPADGGESYFRLRSP